MTNRAGAVCIAFEDPSFTRADKIILDKAESALYAVLNGSQHFLGQVSETMANAFGDKDEVLVCALHTNGSIIDFVTPLCVSGKREN